MITIATLLWDSNVRSMEYSSMYDESWVEKLYRGFKRNVSIPMRFICFVDRQRKFKEPIVQLPIRSEVPSYRDCIQPYELNCAMILVGLDTIVCGNVDHLVDYCLQADRIALPRDPYFPHTVCNGVALVPRGNSEIATKHKGENDMEWVRKFPHHVIDDLFPAQVLSYRCHYKLGVWSNPRIVYFHGNEKPHQLKDEPLVKEHWI